MKALRIYVETMFYNFPTTQECLDIKANILTSMEDKYADLIANDKTEEEAFAIVTSRFGDINELKEVLDFSDADKSANDTHPFSISHQLVIINLIIAFLIASFVIAGSGNSSNGLVVIIFVVIVPALVVLLAGGSLSTFSDILSNITFDPKEKLYNLSSFFHRPFRAWILCFCTTILSLFALFRAWNVEELKVFTLIAIIILPFILLILSGDFSNNSTDSPNEKTNDFPSIRLKFTRAFISSVCIIAALITTFVIFSNNIRSLAYTVNESGYQQINEALLLISELIFIFIVVIILFFTILIASGRYNKKSSNNLRDEV